MRRYETVYSQLPVTSDDEPNLYAVIDDITNEVLHLVVIRNLDVKRNQEGAPGCTFLPT